MKVDIKDLEKSQKQLEIEISKEEFKGFVEKAYQKAGSNMEMKGFRKGKVPREVIEKSVGKEGILVEAGDLAVQDSYKKAVLENNLEPISSPEVKIKKIAIGSPMAFEAKISVLPDVGLPDYRQIAKNIKKQDAEVQEKEIQAALSWVQRSRAKFTAKQEPAQKGDFVEIEYFSPDIPQISRENLKKDAFILGEGHFIPGFEDILIGMKSQEEKKDVVVDIPPDHSFKEIAGKRVCFNIKINSVQSVEFPEITDEFAKSLGSFENLEALKKNIKQGIEQEKEQAEKQKLRNELLDKIGASSKIEIPDVLKQREIDVMLDNFKKDVSQKLNIPYKDYLEKIKKTDEDIRKMLLPQVEKKVKNFLVLREIGKKENIEASPQEVEQEFNRILSRNAVSDQSKVDLDQLRDYTKEVIKTEKTFSLLENLTTK